MPQTAHCLMYKSAKKNNHPYHFTYINRWRGLMAGISCSGKRSALLHCWLDFQFHIYHSMCLFNTYSYQSLPTTSPLPFLIFSRRSAFFSSLLWVSSSSPSRAARQHVIIRLCVVVHSCTCAVWASARRSTYSTIKPRTISITKEPHGLS